jgi:peptidoglycan lytic transglycosylase
MREKTVTRLRSAIGIVLLFSLFLVAESCSHGSDQGRASVQRGMASWYGGKFHGRPTANGERFDKGKKTAAHRTLPFNTVVRVTNRKNGRSVKVRINDRGPFVGGRIIDLSRGAAKELKMIDDGVVPVEIKVLKWGSG